MKEKKYYSAVLHCLGRRRRVAIRLDSAVINSYLEAGYIIEILDTICVVEEPKID